MRLWEIWQLSKAYKSRPSEILRVRDELHAFYLDRAVLLFASHVQEDIDKAAKDKDGTQAEVAAQNALAPWIGIAPKFAEPAATR